jgi:hypothetical protein
VWGMTPIAQSADNAVPDWLNPVSSNPVPDPLVPALILNPEKEKRALVLVQYPILFETVLEKIAAGMTMKSALDNDLRQFEQSDFMKWIKADKNRRAQYEAAEELRTEVWAGEIIGISDATDSMEDVNRSKLRIDTRKWLMSAHNRKKYGESTKIDMTAVVETRKSESDIKSEILGLLKQVNNSGAYLPKGDVIDV